MDKSLVSCFLLDHGVHSSNEIQLSQSLCYNDSNINIILIIIIIIIIMLLVEVKRVFDSFIVTLCDIVRPTGVCLSVCVK